MLESMPNLLRTTPTYVVIHPWDILGVIASIITKKSANSSLHG